MVLLFIYAQQKTDSIIRYSRLFYDLIIKQVNPPALLRTFT